MLYAGKCIKELQSISNRLIKKDFAILTPSVHQKLKFVDFHIKANYGQRQNVNWYAEIDKKPNSVYSIQGISIFLAHKNDKIWRSDFAKICIAVLCHLWLSIRLYGMILPLYFQLPWHNFKFSMSLVVALVWILKSLR